LGKKWAKGREFLGQQRPHCFNGNITAADACAAGYKQNLGPMCLNYFPYRPGDGTAVIRNNLMKYHFVSFGCGLLMHPVSAAC
jgi:hypothetical protein